MIASDFGVTVMQESTRTNAATVARPLLDPDPVRQLSLTAVADRRHRTAVTWLLRAICAKRWHENQPRVSWSSSPMPFSNMSGARQTWTHESRPAHIGRRLRSGADADKCRPSIEIMRTIYLNPHLHISYGFSQLPAAQQEGRYDDD